MENNFKKKGLVLHNKGGVNFTVVLHSQEKKRLMETPMFHCINAESGAQSWVSFWTPLPYLEWFSLSFQKSYECASKFKVANVAARGLNIIKVLLIQ